MVLFARLVEVEEEVADADVVLGATEVGVSEGTWPFAEATPPKSVDANAQTCLMSDTIDGKFSAGSTSV